MSKVKTIERDTHGAENACHTMLGIWLEGGHKTPVNWRTFIDCLQDSESGFKALAHELEQALQAQTEQAPASQSVDVQSSEEASTSGEQQSLSLALHNSAFIL